jgi:hypothetical protein
MRCFALTVVVTVCAIAYTAGSPGAAASVRRNIETVRSALVTLHVAPAPTAVSNAR